MCPRLAGSRHPTQVCGLTSKLWEERAGWKARSRAPATEGPGGKPSQESGLEHGACLAEKMAGSSIPERRAKGFSFLVLMVMTELRCRRAGGSEEVQLCGEDAAG